VLTCVIMLLRPHYVHSIFICITYGKWDQIPKWMEKMKQFSDLFHNVWIVIKVFSFPHNLLHSPHGQFPAEEIYNKVWIQVPLQSNQLLKRNHKFKATVHIVQPLLNVNFRTTITLIFTMSWMQLFYPNRFPALENLDNDDLWTLKGHGKV
jgi:hypothetical protein